MIGFFRTPFFAIFQNELFLNSRRVAPYMMAILFGGNALLWWGWGPAAGRGWATNSDSFIAGVLPVYSFMTLPLFTAVIMADPVIRDFRTGVAPLIFSKPVSRAEYLLGKFLGSFFVLVCCQSAFVITLFGLQAFRKTGVVVQEARVLPYIKHFIVFVVISHLVLASFYFTIGTLTRNSKIVYGLGVAFYPLYIAYQVLLLKSLPTSWRGILDPLLMNWSKKPSRELSAESFNQLIVTYDSSLLINRSFMILIATLCLGFLYTRFVIAERPSKLENFTLLDLSRSRSRINYGLEPFQNSYRQPRASPERIAIPIVQRANTGIRSSLNKLAAAIRVEFRLLRSERSLLVVLPLATLLSFLSLPFQATAAAENYSAAFASSTTNGVLLFLLGVIVFYTGEAMHRDLEVMVEPVLWSMPASNCVLLAAKFLTTVSLALALLILAGLTAIVTQYLRGFEPVELSPYLITYGVILLPGILFMTAVSVAVNVLLRDKYLSYAIIIGSGVGLYFLYNQGHNHWLYNPLLFQLWKYDDLIGAGSNQEIILLQRFYCLAIASACLALAHLGYKRKETRGILVDGRLTGAGWSILLAVFSIATATLAALWLLSLVD